MLKQLKVRWIDEGRELSISRGGEEMVRHPVIFSRRTKSWIKSNGNGKLSHFGKYGMGVLNFLRNSCFRKLTGAERCDEHCYREDGDTMSGCYAQLSTHAMIRWRSGFDVIHNGYEPGTEDFFKVTLPKDGNFDLSMYPTKIWRVDSESSTSCLSLALGLTQKVAEANPNKTFCGISSDYFHVSAKLLRRAAAAGNVVIGHTLSPWFGIDDLKNRISSAHRYEHYGVPTVLWVVTRERWEEKNPEGWALIRDEIEHWDPRSIIGLGYHDRNVQEVASGDYNPWGMCCRFGVDENGDYADTSTGKTLGEGGDAVGKITGTCHRCPVACGVTWMRCKGSSSSTKRIDKSEQDGGQEGDRNAHRWGFEELQVLPL